MCCYGNRGIILIFFVCRPTQTFAHRMSIRQYQNTLPAKSFTLVSVMGVFGQPDQGTPTVGVANGPANAHVSRLGTWKAALEAVVAATVQCLILPSESITWEENENGSWLTEDGCEGPNST